MKADLHMGRIVILMRSAYLHWRPTLPMVLKFKSFSHHQGVAHGACDKGRKEPLEVCSRFTLALLPLVVSFYSSTPAILFRSGLLC